MTEPGGGPIMCRQHPERPAVALFLLLDRIDVDRALGRGDGGPVDGIYPQPSCQECAEADLRAWRQENVHVRRPGEAAGVLWLGVE
jgi:hypothetical protein